MLDEAIAALDKLLVPGHSTIALKLVDWKEVRAAVRDVALAAGDWLLDRVIEVMRQHPAQSVVEDEGGEWHPIDDVLHGELEAKLNRLLPEGSGGGKE